MCVHSFPQLATNFQGNVYKCHMFARLSLCLRNVALNKSGHRSFSTASLKFISLGGKQLVTCIFWLPLILQTWLFQIVPLCFNVFTSHYALSLLKFIIPVHVHCSLNAILGTIEQKASGPHFLIRQHSPASFLQVQEILAFPQFYCRCICCLKSTWM